MVLQCAINKCDPFGRCEKNSAILMRATSSRAVATGGKAYVFRGQTPGVAGKVFQACGVALPPTLRSS